MFPFADLRAAVALHPQAISSQSSVLYWSLISPYVVSLVLPVVGALLLVAALVFYGMGAALWRRSARADEGHGSRLALLALMLLGPLVGAPVVTLICLLIVPLVLFVEDVTGIPAFGLAAAGNLIVLALVALLAARRIRQRAPLRRASLVTGGTATVLLAAVVGMLLVALALFSARSSYTHLASATHAGYRYHLAREDTILEPPTLHLYRCDALGVFCEEVDSLGYDATVRSGLLDMDEQSSTVTARATDGEALFTYRLDSTFFGP